jgi:PAS domain S-box-containing protein
MTPVPEPPDERARLAALRELDLLDSSEEERFTRITRLAKSVFDAPIACVSLIDADREWFVSCDGFDSQGGPREHSFCAYTILTDETLIVSNTLEDERFADNPQVTGSLQVRFYAGHPVCAPDGSRVGAVSVRGPSARDFSPQDSALLADLAHMVEDEIRIGSIARLERELFERTAAHKQAEKVRQKFFDLSIDLLCIADFNGFFKVLSPSWEWVTGYTLDELTRVPFVEFVHPGDREETNREAAKLNEGAQTLDFQNRYICKDGSVRWLFWTAVPDFEEKLIYAVAHDVTQRREWEEALSAAKEEAEHASHAKSDFLAAMSHELRTPLNSVIGFSKVLLTEKEADLSEKQRGYLERIGANGEHLLELINEVLDLAKIEARKVEVDYKLTDIGGLVRDVLSQFEPQVANSPTKLEVEIPDNLPHMVVDSRLFKQILFNLVGNAVKFTPDGTITVRVSTGGNGQPRALEVTDTGIGIPEDKLTKIFHTFEQIDSSASRQFQGSGLGLSICQSLCDVLGYRLTVESVAGRGSTFRVELKEPDLEGEVQSAKEDSQAIPAELVREMELAERHGVSFHDKLVLVIDDDPDSRLILSQCLHELGCQVLTATSAVEGVRLARERAPDLITLDLLMPEMTGWQILGHFAEDPSLRDVPVVVVSAVVRDHGRAIIGASEILEKPIDPEELKRALERNLPMNAGKVLVVDDNSDDRVLMATFLSKGGANVKTASGGREALAILEDSLPDLAIIDLLMPEMDGAELIDTIRHQDRLREMPILLVTGKDLSTEELERLSRASAAVVSKGPQLRGDLNELCWKLWRLRDSSE